MVGREREEMPREYGVMTVPFMLGRNCEGRALHSMIALLELDAGGG